MTDTDGLNPEHVTFLVTWATRHGAHVNFAGEVGFGRPCVGILIGNAYLDYSHLWDLPGYDHDTFWAPEDAYHKHDCMAVLGRGPDAVAQLYEWAKWLDDRNWTVESKPYQAANFLDAIFHGTSTPTLMPPTTQAGRA